MLLLVEGSCSTTELCTVTASFLCALPSNETWFLFLAQKEIKFVSKSLRAGNNQETSTPFKCCSDHNAHWTTPLKRWLHSPEVRQLLPVRVCCVYEQQQQRIWWMLLMVLMPNLILLVSILLLMISIVLYISAAAAQYS